MQLFKRPFSWGLPGFLTLSSYVLGGACWGIAVVSSHYKIFFDLAAILFVTGFISSFRWLWKNEFFRRSKKRYTRRYSDHQPNPHSDIYSHEYVTTNLERRERRRVIRKIRWVAVTFASILFVAIAARLIVSYRFRLALEQSAQVEVYLLDSVRTRAQTVPFIGVTDNIKEMDFATRGVPTREMSVPGDAKSITINVALRNVSDVDIITPRIKIDSNMPLKTSVWRLISLSDTEVGGNLPVLRPFKKPEDEQVYAVEVPIPANDLPAGLLVSMVGENMRPYAAAAKVKSYREH